jgi:putative SOS response-associated peptidase YedK
MCGRYSLRSKAEDIAAEFDLAAAPEWTPRYNLAPTEPVPVLRLRQGGPAVVMMRWGLVPTWVEDIKKAPLLINAKSETAAEKPAFRAAFQRRRCLVLADGWYEWQAEGKLKLPWYHRLRDERPFAFAGLWERWRRGDTALDSATILTTDANEVAGAVHDRMPVILGKQARTLWLDPEVEDVAALQELLRPYPAEEMVVYRVSPVVNKAGNEGPECIAPVH